MTLPASGSISLQQTDVELNLGSTTPISLGQQNVRTLFQVPSGPISLANGLNKARVTGTVYLTSSGTFTVPDTITSITVTIVGGGGGASGSQENDGVPSYGSSGGGSGGYQTTSFGVFPGQQIQYIVGTGGVGNSRTPVTSSGGGFSPPTTSPPVLAKSGTLSNFAGVVSNGGQGGISGANVQPGGASGGGAGGNGADTNGNTSLVNGGNGGSNPVGTGGNGGVVTGGAPFYNGANGTGYGSGGGGAGSANFGGVNPNGTGGNGANGIIIVSY